MQSNESLISRLKYDIECLRAQKNRYKFMHDPFSRQQLKNLHDQIEVKEKTITRLQDEDTNRVKK